MGVQYVHDLVRYCPRQESVDVLGNEILLFRWRILLLISPLRSLYLLWPAVGCLYDVRIQPTDPSICSVLRRIWGTWHQTMRHDHRSWPPTCISWRLDARVDLYLHPSSPRNLKRNPVVWRLALPEVTLKNGFNPVFGRVNCSHVTKGWKPSALHNAGRIIYISYADTEVSPLACFVYIYKIRSLSSAIFRNDRTIQDGIMPTPWRINNVANYVDFLLC